MFLVALLVDVLGDPQVPAALAQLTVISAQVCPDGLLVLVIVTLDFAVLFIVSAILSKGYW